MDRNQIAKMKLTFDDIIHYTEEQIEFWYARELQVVLGYTEWRNFKKVVEKAASSCTNSGYNVADHFVDVNKMVLLGSGAQRLESGGSNRKSCRRKRTSRRWNAASKQMNVS